MRSLRLEATQLGHAFRRRVLFRDLDLSVRGGEVLAVTGRNGAGKSTLVQILAGLRTPSRGEVVLHADGARVPSTGLPFHCALVAPYLNVYDGLTARENLDFLASTRGLPTGGIGEALERVGLAGREDDAVGKFSSGMKQRVKYAAAYLSAPDVLLLDEPSANLDAAGVAVVTGVRDWQRARGGVLVVATNEAAEAAWGDQTVHLA